MTLFHALRAGAGFAACLTLFACGAGQASAPPEPVYGPEETAAIETALADGIAPETTSILIMQGDDILLERYVGNGSASKLNNTRSATKTVVAMAVGLAIEDGHFASVDQPLWPLLAKRAPDGAGDALTRAVTLRDLLTMTSAFHCDDSRDTPGNENNMYPKPSWTAFGLGLPSDPDWTREADGLGPWRYCTVGSFLLGQAIEEAAGMPVDEYVRTRLFEPLEISEFEWFASPSGEIMTGGGLELTARDLAKLGMMMAEGGTWHGKQVIPADWADKMMTAYRETPYGTGYGYQMWQRDYPAPCGPVDVWYMTGNGGNRVLSIPSLEATLVLTRQAYNTPSMHEQSDALIEDYLLAPLACGGS